MKTVGAGAGGDVFSDQTVDTLRELVLQWTGNRLSPDKRSLIESRLRKRFTSSGLSQSDYLRLLEQSETERTEFITALTTHKTDWFRENVHLAFVAEEA